MDGSIKLPGFSGGKRDFAVRGRSDRKILIIIKDELDANPIEIFRRVIDDDATQMANSELASGPTELLGLEGVLVFGIRGGQPRDKKNRFHCAIEAINGLSNARDLKAQRTATEMAVAIHMRVLQHHIHK